MWQGEAGFVALSLLSDLPVSSWAPPGQVTSLPAPCEGSGSGASGSRGGERCDRVPGGRCFQPADGAGSRSTPSLQQAHLFNPPFGSRRCWIMVSGFLFFLHVVVGLESCATSGRAPSITHPPGGQSHRSVPPRPPGPSPSPALFSPNPALARARPWATRSHCPPAFTVRSPRRTRCGGGDGGRGSGSLRCGAR